MTDISVSSSMGTHAYEPATPAELIKGTITDLHRTADGLNTTITRLEAEVADAKAALKQVERSLKAFKNGD